jgi:hypothetical protein
VPWKVAINRAVRAVFAEWDDFGFLFGVCEDAVWVVLNTPLGGVLRDRPEFPAPAALNPGANPPVTFLNAPRTPGLPGSHVQHPSVLRS